MVILSLNSRLYFNYLSLLVAHVLPLVRNRQINPVRLKNCLLPNVVILSLITFFISDNLKSIPQ
jgi:hypothetical protein